MVVSQAQTLSEGNVTLARGRDERGRECEGPRYLGLKLGGQMRV
jgi:hypothetical protein